MSKPQETGYIYVLSNKSYPGILKIGMTVDSTPGDIATQLFTAGVPSPFVVEYATKVDNCYLKVRDIHSCLGDFRYNPHQYDFYKISMTTLFPYLRLLGGERWVDSSVDTTTMML